VAISISSASQLANAVDANFSSQAVAVSVANLVAHAVGASFAKGAARVFRAGQHAGATLAGVSFGTLSGGRAKSNLAQTALLSVRDGLEAAGTVAVDVVVDDLAQGVGAARPFLLAGI